MIKTEITGTTYVHVREGQYGAMCSVQLSKKNKDDQWENGYINAQFKKDAYVSDGDKIEIKSGWLSFYKTKDNKYVHYIFINDFEIIESRNSLDLDPSNFQTVEGDEKLPF